MARLGSFPQGFIETVRGAGDITRVVSDYVPLKPAGSRLKGLCPFHEEKTPSFSVDPARQLFYCFGCQTGGDVFKFVQLYEKVPFPEAVELLAKRAGLALPDVRGASGTGTSSRLELIHEAAEAWFRSMLGERETGRAARDYLKRRALGEALVAELKLGFAPDAWEGLRAHLLARRFSVDEALVAGLLLPRKGGSGQYDRFRNRLIFPIRDVNGRTIAFGGRALGDAEPKYINSPETETYKKGGHLYGLDLAKEEIRRRGFAIVVEGYLDLAAVRQAGHPNVVASLGTAFTAAQAKLLNRYCHQVAWSYDGDPAGEAATARSIELLSSQGFGVRVVELDPGLDPDEFIRAQGAESYAARVREAPEYLEFIIRRETRKADPRRIESKVAVVNAVLPHLAKLESAVERGSWSARLADALRVDDELVLQELRRAARTARPRIRERRPGARRLRPAAVRLVALLLESEEERRRWVAGERELADIEPTGVLPIVSAIVELARRGVRVDYPTVLETLEDEAERTLLTRIAFREEPAGGPSADECLAALRRPRLTEGLRQEIRELKQNGSGDGLPADVDRRLTRALELAKERDALA